jgi:hypothetical protein
MNSNTVLSSYFTELKKNKLSMLFLAISILASYSVYFLCSDSRLSHLADENDFFELGTSFLFFIGAIFLFVSFIKTKNIFFLLLSILLLLGSGEELSWGQHIFNYSTPEMIKSDNVQGEFNIHNLEVLNTDNFDGTKKSGWTRLLEINFLFKIFCLIYGIIFPVLMIHWNGFKRLVSKLKLPIPKVSIGIFFMLNWIVYRCLLSVLPIGKPIEYYQATTEIYEFVAALIFFFISIYMHIDINEKQK